MKNRYQKIMELCEEKTVSVEELAEILKVSPSTIRRDLAEMEDRSMITRVYGGAKINSEQIIEPNMSWKNIIMSEEKNRIARYAASLVKPGDIVFIDGGTTTDKIIDYITARDVLIITQGLNCIEKCIERKFRCYSFGGYVRERTNVLIGTEVIEKAKESIFNVAFVAANGVHPFTGFTCNDEMEGGLKEAIISRAMRSYICMDSSKINKLNKCKFADINQTLITDVLVEDFDYSILKKTISVTEDGIIEV
ncbi:MAG: DeoR/GlpR transcriptional regulator [Erysipelotrichaceae bacterium]|nr:DeoR/GlpR transcriptional regulator [Erysipelotrichaceae bacterium]